MSVLRDELIQCDTVTVEQITRIRDRNIDINHDEKAT
eukprot:CAMPEP_0197064444 /NCGR_PEP_ID=MMETSP1384-20130603/159239_1 /TAXON_ID=29189 /ORGANISM="Ammonia sp." /LENGTH=36 /DNA_ID= /DNA_START= /DNA_END= /DNA_ORIENTATION=